MLRLILLAWFTPPTNHQQHRDLVDLLVTETHERVNNVAKPTVLEVDHWELIGGQVVASCDAYSSAFIGSYDVLFFRHIVTDESTEVF